MEDIRFFIFKLKHLKGIGNKGLLKILSFYLDNKEEPITLERFILIGQVKKQYQTLFTNSFWQSFCTITEDDFEVFQYTYHFITILDDVYPECLAEIYDPPIALFMDGSLNWLTGEKLAMIGSRNMTKYGREVSASLLPEIVKHQITIVSGLARGNDAVAHQLTTRLNGRTVAVIGCGLDIHYPAENSGLQEYLCNNHLVVSEYLPGVPPMAYHFPSRNRIIAGLSRGVCVIEAEKKSGTFITASLALEEGRDVFAVPGHALKTTSEGCHRLIQEGAKCVWRSEDILNEWGLS